MASERLPLQLQPLRALRQSLRRGWPPAAFSRCRRAPGSRRLTTLLPDLWPRVTQCASLLPAPAGECVLRETTSEAAPGGEQGPHLPAAMGENQGKGQGRPANKGLGFVLEKTTEKDQVRAPRPRTHAHSDRGARRWLQRGFCGLLFNLFNQTIHVSH